MDEFLDEKEVATETKKCPSCGAAFEYDIQTGNLKCGHCGTMEKIDDEKDRVIRRELTDKIAKDRERWNEGSVFCCSGCGAKEVLDKKDITRVCAFCGSNNIVGTEELAQDGFVRRQ